MNLRFFSLIQAIFIATVLLFGPTTLANAEGMKSRITETQAEKSVLKDDILENANKVDGTEMLSKMQDSSVYMLFIVVIICVIALIIGIVFKAALKWAITTIVLTIIAYIIINKPAEVASLFIAIANKISDFLFPF